MKDQARTADGLPRREFIKRSAAATLGLVCSRLPLAAGALTREDFEHLVPADKKLSPEWIHSLFARGEPQIFRGTELEKIEMPVGGFCAGQLHLGGDGRLWLWDIFNQYVDSCGGLHYAKPPPPTSPLQQGFTLETRAGKQTQTRRLQAGEWSDVSFRGEYPIGRVEYADPASLVRVTLEAYSPFVPLNTEDSSLPATIFEFTLRNTATTTVVATLRGELENGVCLNHRDQAGVLRNQVLRRPGLTTLLCSAERAPGPGPELVELPDYGTMALALPGKPADETSADAAVPFSEKVSGALGRRIKLKPGATAKVRFILAWHFPNFSLKKLGRVGRHYATRFDSATAVAEYVAKNFERLSGETKLWRDTWYDSSLPYWFLDRTFLNISTLATSTCYRFASGRFWGWEGVGNCEGTCGHVYLYAQAIARLFPDLERMTREHVDFGLAQQPDGAIYFRGEFNNFPAVDAQAGYVLRALREHQMSANSDFLRRNWPRIKLAMQWLIAKDGDGDGLIESNQHNTLDTDWYGKVAWLSGLYQAALHAAAQMADAMDDQDFAVKCRSIAEGGRKNLVEQLFDGEYFFNKVDPKHLDAINSGTGCEIDQVFGQSWAFQVGLPRVLPQKETVSALKSLWRYNFSPDVGPYRAVYKSGRWYAMAGEPGLLMCTFPRRDWDYEQAKGKGPEWAAGYFNECMNGFEHQVAGHMLWEGLQLEGLAIERALHDRYHPSRRNPWNEIECGDHYARSMASYGVFLAACGFEYHGPRAHLGFAPKLSAENFRAAFTSAEGWGSYSQKADGAKLESEIAVRWGKLKIKTLALECPQGTSVRALHGTKALAANMVRDGSRILVTLTEPVEVAAGQKLRVWIS